MSSNMEKPAYQQHEEITHKGHQERWDTSEKEDKWHEDQFLVAAGEVLGEDITGEEATNRKTRESKSPHQIDSLCVCLEVVC